MSGPVNPPLEVKESDDSVELRPTNVISFDSTDFNITTSGQTATITTSGTAGTIGGSISAGEVAFGAATADSIEGIAAFTYDKATNVLQLGPEAGGATCQLRMNDHDTEGSAEWRTELKQSGASLYVENTDVDGSTTIQVARLSNTYSRWNYNQANVNFSIGTTGSATLVWVDGGNDNVGIGAGISPSSDVERLHVTGTGSDATLVRFESTDTDANAGPNLQLYRNPGEAGVVNDDLGKLEWWGADNAAAVVEFSEIQVEAQGVTAGSQHGRMMFRTMMSGTLTEFMRASNMGVEINAFELDINTKISSADIDGIFTVDAGNNNIGIGGAPDSGVERLHVIGTGKTPTPLVCLESTNLDPEAAPIIQFYRNSDSPAVDDYIGELQFVGNDDDDPPNQVVYAKIRVKIDDETEATEDGDFAIRVERVGTLRTMLRIKSTEIVFNEDSQDCNFRVESDDESSMFKIDANENLCGIGGAPTAGEAQFQVNLGASFLSHVERKSTGTTLTDYEMHNTVVLDEGSSQTYTLPTAMVGYDVTLTSSNSTMTIRAQLNEEINGVTEAGGGESDVDLAQYLIGRAIANNEGGWHVGVMTKAT